MLFKKSKIRKFLKQMQTLRQFAELNASDEDLSIKYHITFNCIKSWSNSIIRELNILNHKK